jgi:hypothetical protein
MHKTLKAEARSRAGLARGPAAPLRQLSRGVQQERPHEALGNDTPPITTCRRRAVPGAPAGARVPGHFEVRYVSRNGGVRWRKPVGQRQPRPREEYVGSRRSRTASGCVLRARLLGRFDERDLRIHGAHNRNKLHRHQNRECTMSRSTCYHVSGLPRRRRRCCARQPPCRGHSSVPQECVRFVQSDARSSHRWPLLVDHQRSCASVHGHCERLRSAGAHRERAHERAACYDALYHSRLHAPPRCLCGGEPDPDPSRSAPRACRTIEQAREVLLGMPGPVSETAM